MTAKSGPIGRALADSLKNADIPARDAMRARARRPAEPHPGVLERPRRRDGWGETPAGPSEHRSA